MELFGYKDSHKLLNKFLKHYLWGFYKQGIKDMMIFFGCNSIETILSFRMVSFHIAGNFSGRM